MSPDKSKNMLSVENDIISITHEYKSSFIFVLTSRGVLKMVRNKNKKRINSIEEIINI